MDITELGNRIREERELRARSHKDISEITGIHVNTLSGIERGKHKPRPSTLRKIADALGVDVEDLTGAPKAEAPPSPAKRSPEERRSSYLAGLGDLVRSAEARLQEAIGTGNADFDMVRQTDELHEDLHRIAVEKIGLLQGLEDMPEKEAESHEQVAAALDDLRSVVDQGYSAAISMLQGRKAEVRELDRIRQRGRTAEESRGVRSA